MTPPLAAVITPYYKEPREVLERCMASVRAQTVSTLHIMVADGHPQGLPTGERLRHIALDQPEQDWGNTPRAIGAMLAINTGVKMIALLDADNWYDPDHLETALQAAAGSALPVDVVFAKRRFCRADESVMPLRDEPTDQLVDTNCYVMFEGAFHHLTWWGTIPKELASGADRGFRRYLAAQPELVVAEADRPTVNYLCQWRSAYEAIGETPPPDAKEQVGPHIRTWLKKASDRERLIAERRFGVKLKSPDQL